MANFGLFYRSLKSRNLVTIARNMLPSITVLLYANRGEKICPFTISKASPDIILTRVENSFSFILITFRYSEPEVDLSLNLAIGTAMSNQDPDS